MLSEIPVSFDANTRVVPKGHDCPDEAKLDGFGPTWLQEHSAWGALREWWLVNTHGANTPNWDLLVTCSLDGNPGLILVEAKANWPELSRQGKPLSQDASPKSHENHKQIGAAIDEARAGWQEIDPDVQISRDSHYQLSNRLAFAWKLASLGIPTVLIYLGFTGDEVIRDVGRSLRGRGRLVQGDG